MKTAVLVTMPNDTPEHRGRMSKALHLAAGLYAKGAPVKLVFGGRGVEWLPQLTGDRDAAHPFVKNYGRLFDEVRHEAIACNFCCIRFDTRDVVEASGVPIHGEGRDHMALEDLVLDGWNVIPF